MDQAVTVQDDSAPKRPYHALRAIPDIDRKILEGIGAGRSLKSIADAYSVTDVAILQRARKHPEYKEQLAVGVELRMDKREQELEKAQDNVSVTRADRLLGHARWIAERSCPDAWGGKPMISLNIQSVSISEALAEARGRLIDAAPQQVQCSMESEPETGEESA